MSKDIAKKLDFLMSLTNTSNSQLARELKFDASYISRIRSGKRGVPLHQPFARPAAAYLATRVSEHYQTRALEQALGIPGEWPAELNEAARILEKWIVGESNAIDIGFGALFDSLSPHSASRRSSDTPPFDPESHAEGKAIETRCFFGASGRRDAVITFLSDLAVQEKPYELLLYSDEPLDWFTEDAAFLAHWMTLLTQIIDNGSTIKIIHTLSRDVGELLDAVQSWLPFYLKEAVTSYYCPKIRDGICQRTLIIARGALALISNTVKGNIHHAASMLIEDKETVASCEHEFADLFALCKPLVTVISFSNMKQIREALLELGFGETTIILAHNPLCVDPIGVLADKLPENERESVASIEASVELLPTNKLPERTLVLIRPYSSFVLMNMSDMPTMMHVSERLLTAAFVDYLG